MQNVLTKMLRVTKLMTFLLLAALLQVSAAGLAQTITLSVKNAPLQRIFSAIEQQTGYVVIYNDALVREIKAVSLTADHEPIGRFMEQLLKDQPLSFTILNSTISIRSKLPPAAPAKTVAPPGPVPSIDIHGLVTDPFGHPLAGASVGLRGSDRITITDEKGIFTLTGIPADAILTISFIGFTTRNIDVNGQQDLSIRLQVSAVALDNVQVTIHTGYQNISKERTTGSYDVVNNTLLNRRVSPDILSRIADLTPGLIFNRDQSSSPNSISIRGQSTLFSNPEPLIILDNFPYESDITNINPNDVESITILKDAAAASIWGTRAGNGVIVITTKKGRYEQPLKVSVNTNLTLGEKPDPFYLPSMSTGDYIDIEKKLFAEGYYQSFETDDNKPPLTPVVELLIAQRDGLMDAATVNAQIDHLRTIDVRNDYKRYLEQTSVNQQYSVNVSGGGLNRKFYLSAGYDNDLSSSVGDQYRRVTVNGTNVYSLLDHKLELTTEVYFSSSSIPQNALTPDELWMSPGTNLYPYAQLADAAGHPQSVVHDYRTSFIQSAEQQGLLDWTYEPLDDIHASDRTTTDKEYRIDLNAKYRVLPFLSAELQYQYGYVTNNTRFEQSQYAFYTRDLINQFTIVNPDGSLTRPVPLGGILDYSYTNSLSNNLRGQLDFQHSWSHKSSLTAIAGAELRDLHATGIGSRLYGYDPNHATSQAVDYVNFYTSYVNPSNTYDQVPNMDGLTDLTDRYLSYYGNATYSFKEIYLLSASARLDQSNLFGVKTNQKGVPLYSAGIGYILSKESFYHLAWLPFLKLRSTFGYNGNINKNLSAYTTALYFPASGTDINQPFGLIQNPPNPELRWERVRIINTAVDFAALNSRLSGSLEYYIKNGIDLIGNTPYAPQTGILTFKGNNTNTKGNGIELTLNAQVLSGPLSWSSTFLFTHESETITHYLTPVPNIATLLGGGSTNYPVEGKPLYSMFSLPWAGLDPQTGDPRGIYQGKVSKDYGDIISSSNVTTLKYNGSSRPVTYGALRNTFEYKNLSISINISYRLGYFVRKESVSYGTVLSANGGWGDYDKRWQKPGDEKLTQVPSLPDVDDYQRDEFYQYSDVLVERGDNIRLQDCNLTWSFSNHWFSKQSPGHLQLYFYANNLGIIWKAGKGRLDPDYQNQYFTPPVKTFSFGIRTDL